jgi:Protein of unknown function (DUF3604)
MITSRSSLVLPSLLGAGLAVVSLVGAACSDPPAPTAGADALDGAPQAPDADPAAATRCPGYRATKNAYFGDLHIHTAYSLDSFSFANRNDPAAAYRFARGLQASPVAAGEGGTVTVPALNPPLDFAAVTDHSEFLSMMGLCQYGAATTPTQCASLADQNSTRQNAVVLAAGSRLLSPSPAPLSICQDDPAGCATGERSAWQRLRSAAADAYAPCTFSSLIGYEWTATTGGANLHRNVIFGSDQVPAVPYDYIDYPSALALWQALDRGCKATQGCRALTIPHNSNFSAGKMWDTADDPAERDFMVRYQKLVEIYQHKGNSECLATDALGDPECAFEVVANQDNAAGYVRAGLAKGLTLESSTGVNPLAMGIIGSTDTHNGTPGAVREDAWRGHGANNDDTAAERLGAPTFGPGGVAAVWAEQNTRESIFAALERRETYATSGPRIKVRTYALAGVSDAQAQAFCADPDFPAQLIAAGAKPMGGNLSTTTAPTFFVSAMADQTALASFDIVRLRDQQTSIHTETLSGGAATTFCRAWKDPTFVANRPAAYYVRVMQQPTPRWSSYDCQVAPTATACTDGSLPPTIRERAWTSPIFVSR